jgi:hypothetical protein
LGEFATEFANSQKDKALIDWINSQEYPIMVDKVPAILPVPLNQIVSKPVQPSSQTNSNSGKNERTVINNYLESLRQLPGYEPGETDSQNVSPDFTQVSQGEADESQSESDVSPDGEIFHPDSDDRIIGGSWHRNEVDFTLASQILKLRKEGKTQTQSIKAIWGLNPGKSQKYLEAVENFKAIKSRWESLNLW